jgi:CheY-like chemotaxis protein
MVDGQHLVLCVDDDPDVLDYLELTLQAGGFTVLTAGSAEEGLRTYKQHHPDAVIVDLMMETVDAGLNFAKELQLLHNDAPIFLLSSIGDDYAKQADPAEYGLAGIFQKPLNSVRLLSVLNEKLQAV